MAVALAHQVVGNGPPLVILHGLFGSGRNWASLARRLGEDWQVHCIDLRNHGSSPWDEVMTYRAMADDLQAYLDSQGLARAAVIGHSMGGKSAMVHALTRGAAVAALVVVDIAPVTYGHSFTDYIGAMRALDLSGLSRRSEADAALKTAIPEPGVRSFILQNLESRDGALAWRLNLTALAEHMDALTGFPDDLQDRSYDGPCLFLHGGKSDYVGPHNRAEIEARFPAAAITSVPDAGHWVHAEQPEAFLAQVTPFLRSHGSR